LFDSANIDKSGKSRETQLVEANGGVYYYFTPMGSLSIPKTDKKFETDPTVLASLAADAATEEGQIATAARVPSDDAHKNSKGRAYYYHAGTLASGETRWYYFDYKAEYAPKYLVEPSISPDGTYTVTYKISFKGIVSELSFAIRVGDNADPIITFGTEDQEKESFRKYTLGKRGDDKFIFKTTDIHVNPNGGSLTPTDGDGYFASWYVARKLIVNVTTPSGKSLYFSTAEDDAETVYLHSNRQISDIWLGKPDVGFGDWVQDTVNGPTSVNAPRTRDIWFALKESGDYSFQLRIDSESGQPAYYNRTITVEPKPAKTKIAPQTIWGILLIVISSGLLLGVIVYFIQTGRKTKFAAVTTGGEKGNSVGSRFLNKFKSIGKNKPAPIEAAKPDAGETPNA
jgi:hypothetical protein